MLPQTFRGVVLGCALRCEGGYEYIVNLKNYANQCVDIATEWEKLTKEQLEGEHGELTNKQNQYEDAKRYLSEAEVVKADIATLKKNERELKNLRTALSEKQIFLSKKEQDLELSMQRMKQELEMEASAEMLKEKAEAKLPKYSIGKRPAKRTNLSAEHQIGPTEAKIDDLKGDGNSENVAQPRSKGTTVGGDEPGTEAQMFEELQQSLSNHCWSLMSAANATFQLRQLVENLRMEVDRIAKDLSVKQMQFQVENKKEELRGKLDHLRRQLQILACNQQDIAKERKSKNHLRRALKLSGTSLQNALILGFDMDSEGLPSALARIFCRVSVGNTFIGV